MKTPHDRPSFRSPKSTWRLVAVASVILALQTCAVAAVTDAAVKVVTTGVQFAVKAEGAIADAVIP